jgi:hypothetical protein
MYVNIIRLVDNDSLMLPLSLPFKEKRRKQLQDNQSNRKKICLVGLFSSSLVAKPMRRVATNSSGTHKSKYQLVVWSSLGPNREVFP